MKNLMKLNKRQDCPEGFYYANDDTRKWSVVDFGTSMKTAPDFLKNSGIFMGWEAFEIINDKLETDRQYRADTWEELKKQL